MVPEKNRLIGVAHSLMDLVTLTGLPVKLERDLFRRLLSGYRRMDRQQSETWQSRDTALETIGNHCDGPVG